MDPDDPFGILEAGKPKDPTKVPESSRKVRKVVDDFEEDFKTAMGRYQQGGGISVGDSDISIGLAGDREFTKRRRDRIEYVTLVSGGLSRIKDLVQRDLEKQGFNVNVIDGSEPNTAKQNGAETVYSKLRSTQVMIICVDPSKKSKSGGGMLDLFGSGDDSTFRVDSINVEKWLANSPSLEHVILLSPLGIDRRDRGGLIGMFTDLDDKRRVEESIIQQSNKRGLDYSFVRVGKLEPLAGEMAGIRFEAGDSPSIPLDAMTTQEAAAQCLVRCVHQRVAYNATMSLASAPGKDFPQEWEWDDAFIKLDGPELYRESIQGMPVVHVVNFLKDWARLWLREGQYYKHLTTPVAIRSLPGGVRLQFNPRRPRVDDDYYEEPVSDSDWSRPQPPPNKEGGVDIVAEDWPYTRVRALRSCLGRDVTVKETSEAAIVEFLKKDVRKLKKTRGIKK